MNWGPIINNYYDLSKMTNNVAVNYKYESNLLENDNLTFSTYFKLIGKTSGNVIFLDGSLGSPIDGLKISGQYNRTNNILVLNINLNTLLKTYTLTDIIFDNWYNLIIEISNEFQQIGVYLYEPIIDSSMTNNWNDFTQIFKKIETLTRTIINTTENYKLLKGDLYLSNIRLFNYLVKEENHKLVMSMLTIKDEGNSPIVDNCKRELKIPYIALNK